MGKIVDDHIDQENFVDRMGEITSDTETAIYCWSLMSNHAHILLCSGCRGLPQFMRHFLTEKCTEVRINVEELRMSSLRRSVARVRFQIVVEL